MGRVPLADKPAGEVLVRKDLPRVQAVDPAHRRQGRRRKQEAKRKPPEVGSLIRMEVKATAHRSTHPGRIALRLTCLPAYRDTCSVIVLTRARPASLPDIVSL